MEPDVPLFAARLLAALLMLALAIAGALGGPLHGVALVIGESSYTGLPALANPTGDARAVGRLLDDLGFDVTRVTDADARTLRQKLARFAEDAADADVALVYYSGHGIEAGGENYLIPTDASVATPEAAGAALLPLSEITEALAKAAPVSIILLDACRSDPFPAGQVILPPGAAVPLAVAPAGLGVARGPTVLAAANADRGLGTVIGFAAAPGESALDGPPGGHSPYAEALLEHLGAAGFSFGDVMTLVGEEVYLRTRARQLPWTNSSLRRVLSFVPPPTAGDADEARITGARRQLLLSIATTPEAQRHTVESVATANDVPLDALYGMLGLLAVGDTGNLEQKLASGAQKLKAIMAEHTALQSGDAEIDRLARLAEDAQAQGVIALALEFRDKASARAETISGALDTAETQLRQKRLELAQTFASNAETATLAFDFRMAAKRYGDAMQQVAAADPLTAFIYAVSRANALGDDGLYRGDIASLEAAIAQLDAVAKALPQGLAPDDYANLYNKRGTFWQRLADATGDQADDDKATADYGEALRHLDRATAPANWARVAANMAVVLANGASRTLDSGRLATAIDTYRDAIAVARTADDPLTVARTLNGLANALVLKGTWNADAGALEEAIAALTEAQSTLTLAAHPIEWVLTENGLAGALKYLAQLRTDPVMLQRSAEAYEAALAATSRDATPSYWANLQNNLGAIDDLLAEVRSDRGFALKSVAAFSNALEILTEDAAPADWARTKLNRGVVLAKLGAVDADAARYRAAIADFSDALRAIDKTRSLANWDDANAKLTAAEAALAALKP